MDIESVNYFFWDADLFLLACYLKNRILRFSNIFCIVQVKDCKIL